MGLDDKAFSRFDHLVLVACSARSSPVAHRTVDHVDLRRTGVVHPNETGIWKAAVQDLQVPHHGSGRRDAHVNETQGPTFKVKNDPRITPVGRFLRETSLDELPRLINVLIGDMSL